MIQKKTATVPVQKHAQFTIRAEMSPREEREFTEEFTHKIGQGYRVATFLRSTGVTGEVIVQLVKDETWTIPEFVAELQSMARGA